MLSSRPISQTMNMCFFQHISDQKVVYSSFESSCQSSVFYFFDIEWKCYKRLVYIYIGSQILSCDDRMTFQEAKANADVQFSGPLLNGGSDDLHFPRD